MIKTIAGQEHKGPSIAELQRFIKEQARLELMLVTGKSMHGVLKWFDEQAFAITQDDGAAITIMRSAIIGYKQSKPAGPGKKPGK